MSLDTEFIENESESVSKQDCENRAAKRLMDRIKRDFEQNNHFKAGRSYSQRDYGLGKLQS